MKRIHFNPEINLGHIAQLCGGLLVLLGLCHAFDKRVTLLEREQAALVQQVVKVSEATAANSATLVRVVTLMEKRHEKLY